VGPLRRFDIAPLAGEAIAITAARNFRTLRARGVTVRKTIDLLIGTWCIENRVPLLHNDRDFAPMVKHLGLMKVSGGLSHHPDADVTWTSRASMTLDSVNAILARFSVGLPSGGRPSRGWAQCE
jgi:hypothetical protein